MAVITTGSFAKALWPGINTWFGLEYDGWKTEYTDLMDTDKSTQNYEEDVEIMGFGLAQVKNEGSAISYDEARQSFVTRYNNVVYALGTIITREMWDDKQYRLMENRARALAESMRITKETVCANVYNRAFTAAYAGGDGKEMCATDHPQKNGGTWSNELTTAADLSEASLEQACIDIASFTDDRGLQIKAMPKCVIVPKELKFEAERILKSSLQSGTANNDLNALSSTNMFPEGIKINHYLTDAKAWFIRTNVRNGPKIFQRWNMEFSTENDFDTMNARFKATERYVPGWSNARGVFGSPGA